MSREVPPKLVKSAIRTIEIFTLFAEAKKPLSLAEIAVGMDAPKSSCYELIQSFIYLGYMLVIDDGKTYYPSRRLFDVVEQINTYNPVKLKIQNSLKALRSITGETVLIGRLQGNNVVYTEVFDGTHNIRFTAQAGELHSLHASALGKALLGGMEEEARSKLIAEMSLSRYNDNTITKKKDLKDRIAACTESGIFTSLGEYYSDVMA